MGEDGTADLWIPADQAQDATEFWEGGGSMSCISADMCRCLFFP